MVFRRQSSFRVAERATMVSPDLQEDIIIAVCLHHRPARIRTDILVGIPRLVKNIR